MPNGRQFMVMHCMLINIFSRARVTFCMILRENKDFNRKAASFLFLGDQICKKRNGGIAYPSKLKKKFLPKSGKKMKEKKPIK